jgi:V8-like Glu-specific endopeptidase
MRQRSVLGLGVILALHFCGSVRSQAAEAGPRSVFGTDTRQGAASWLPIGPFKGGTAFAVGPHTMMSAAHVVYGASFPATIEMNDGNFYTVSSLVEAGASIAPGSITDDQIANDWSIMRIQGTFPKWFRLSSMQTEGESVQLAGYSQDRSGASIDANCSIRAVYGTLLNHDCGMVPGASGAPIFHYGNDDGTNVADFYVIGIQSAQICNRADGNCLYSGGWDASITNSAAAISDHVIAVINQLNGE